MKRIIIRMLAVALLLTATIAVCVFLQTPTHTAKIESQPATVGEIADFFIQAADDYNANLDRAELLTGFDASAPATQLEMFVLVSRAFGSLPAPTGNSINLAPSVVNVEHAPEWTKLALNNLSAGGVLAASDLGLTEKIEITGSKKNKEESIAQEMTEDGQAISDVDAAKKGDATTSSDGTDKMEEPVTLADAKRLVARFYRLFGTNLKDDFYTAVNKSDLDTLEIPEGASTIGGSSTVEKTTNQQLHDLITEIKNNSKDYPTGSAEQKIRDFYNSVLDVQTRNQAGIAPLKKYIDAVDNAQNFSELNKAIALAVTELGNPGNGLFPMVAVTDTQDSSHKVMQLLTYTPMFSAADYADAGNEAIKEYRASMILQLMTAGESKTDATLHADGLLKLEQELAENMTAVEDLNNLQNKTKRYTPEALDQLMPEAQPSTLLSAIGLLPSDIMQVFDDQQFAVYATWFTEENLELFQAIQKIAMLTSFSQYLSAELAETFGYQNGNADETANEAVQTFLSEELGQIYVSRYFLPEDKAEIEKMVQMMIDAFKERIHRLDWMEEKTKQEALQKLDATTVLIGYPDIWDLNNAEIKSIINGGSYFSNVAASEADKWTKMVKGLNEPVNPRRFPLAAFTVNAAASRNTNTIIFPAGILQAPFYDNDASFEANLGAIGSTIAHEITHMFDDGGAQYDASGTVRNWWTDGDYAHFQDFCKKVELYYTGYEAAPGIVVNEKETLSENISDIGGIACSLEVLSNLDNPNYDAFFRSYARQWLRVANYETLQDLAETDQHAPNILRCNRVLSNFQEFLDTYKIGPGDGMYVAPEDRIVIW